MRSRVLIGVGAWLLGAVSATAGSLYAVAQLGQGLVDQPAKQVTVAMVNAELAQDEPAAPNLYPPPGTSPTSSPKAAHGPASAGTGSRHPVVPPVTRNPQKVLTSKGGVAAAACGLGGARLLYESPAQGFEVTRVGPGPSPEASVTFTNSSIGVTVKVTCGSSGTPTGHVSQFSLGGWSPHHDE